MWEEWECVTQKNSTIKGTRTQTGVTIVKMIIIAGYFLLFSDKSLLFWYVSPKKLIFFYALPTSTLYLPSLEFDKYSFLHDFLIFRQSGERAGCYGPMEPDVMAPWSRMLWPHGAGAAPKKVRTGAAKNQNICGPDQNLTPRLQRT